MKTYALSKIHPDTESSYTSGFEMDDGRGWEEKENKTTKQKNPSEPLISEM